MMSITLCTQCTNLTEEKHSEHLKAETWLGEESQHGQSRGKLPQFSIPGGEILVLIGKKRKCMTEQKEIL